MVQSCEPLTFLLFLDEAQVTFSLLQTSITDNRWQTSFLFYITFSSCKLAKTNQEIVHLITSWNIFRLSFPFPAGSFTKVLFALELTAPHGRCTHLFWTGSKVFALSLMTAFHLLNLATVFPFLSFIVIIRPTALPLISAVDYQVDRGEHHHLKRQDKTRPPPR